MSINISDSFDISKEGLAILNEDAELLFYLAAGSGEPTGTVSEKTFYYDTDSNLFWRSFGGAAEEWVCVDLGPKINSVWSLGTIEDSTSSNQIDCGELPITRYRNVIDLGELG